MISFPNFHSGGGGEGCTNIFGNLSLHATFQKPRTTPSGIQVTGGEEERQAGAELCQAQVNLF